MTFDLLQGFQHMLMQHGSTSHSPGHHWLHSRSSRQVHVKTEIPQIFAAHLDCLLFPIACSGASTRRFPARRCLPPPRSWQGWMETNRIAHYAEAQFRWRGEPTLSHDSVNCARIKEQHTCHISGNIMRSWVVAHVSQISSEIPQSFDLFV